MPPKQPAPVTLARYGMTSDEFWAMWADQGEACGFCGADCHDKYVLDHEHSPGWKALSPEVRVTFVRGIIGVFENFRLLPKGMTATRAANAASYLARYEQRRAA